MSAAIIAQAGAGLLSFVQGLTSGQSQSSSTADPSSNASTGTTTGHHHHHGGALEKLASALTTALQSAGSGGGTDVNKTITDALTKIFKTGSLGTTGTADADGDDDGSTASTTGDTPGTTNTATGSKLPDALTQVLKAFGVTPQQFQTDLNNAVSAAQSSGQFDPSVLLKNFPTGSVVDTTG